MTRERVVAITVGAVVLVVLVVAVGLATGFLADGDGVEDTTDDRAGPSADTDAASSTEPGTAATESTATSTLGDGDASPSTTAPPTLDVTTDTVEADEAPVPVDAENQDDDSEAPFDTQPTIPPATAGSCEITAAALAGRIGPVELGDEGACGDIGATIQPVVPQDDLADTDWGRDLRVCEKHPAAEGITVTVITGGGAIELAPNLSRGGDEGAANPIDAIDIAFGDGVTGGTSPRPIVVCRTASAELSIVHHPTG